MAILINEDDTIEGCTLVSASDTTFGYVTPDEDADVIAILEILDPLLDGTGIDGGFSSETWIDEETGDVY